MSRHARALLLMMLVALSVQGCSWRSLLSWTGLFRRPRPAVTAPPRAAAEPAVPQPTPALPEAASVPGTPDARTLLLSSDRAFERDSLEDAEVWLNEALAIEPGDAAALSRWSRLHYRTGRHALAVERLSAVRDGRLAMAPAERHTLLAGLALHLDALGEWAEADAVLRELPASERVADGGARVFLMLRSETPEAARELAERAAETDRRSAVHLNNLGIVQLRQGDAEAARRSFLRALELDAARPGPYYNLALLDKYYRLDDDSAAGWFARYRTRSSEDPDSLFAVFGRIGPPSLAGREP